MQRFKLVPRHIAVGFALTVLTVGVGVNAAALSAPKNSKSAAARNNSDLKERRVDLATPKFSDPTSITNPLFPISDLDQVIQLGEDQGEPLRVEVTLLPKTRTIKWKGQQVEVLVSQFIAYLDGRVLEVAVDYFAQADDGSVWYFGEKVDNYENGVIANHDGSWLAGKDGRPGMIMPANPKVGDVYRPENIPGLVFEEVTVKAVNQVVDGPQGHIEGAIRVEELLMDGTTEHKMFAPGYGEFLARAEDELVILALAVPIDGQGGSLPGALKVLSRGAAESFDGASAGNWNDTSATLDSMTAAWESYQSGSTPKLLETQAEIALQALDRTVDAKRPGRVRQAAVRFGLASLDFELRYRHFEKVDLDRIGLYGRRLVADNEAGNPPAVAGDVAVIETIWDRIAHTLSG